MEARSFSDADSKKCSLSSDYDSVSVSKLKTGIPFLPEPMFQPAPTFKVGDLILGRYQVRELIEGGFGEIYRCYDQPARREVALKTVITQKKRTGSIFAFYQEISMRLTMRNHPNVLRLRLVELINGYPYLVSDWIEGDPSRGPSLRDWLNASTMTVEELIRFSFHILYGLQVCRDELSTERQPYVYGDLKPENVLISREHIPVLADFSLNSSTKGYQSPEQERNEPLDSRSDIFNFGKVLDEMRQRCQGLDDSAWAQLEKVIGTCLRPCREERYDSFENLLSSLGEIAKYYGLVIRPPAESAPPSNLEVWYTLYSKINLGMPLPISPPFDGYCLYASGRKFMTMAEYMEYTAFSNRRVYEAEAFRCAGKLEESSKILTGIHPSKREEFYYFTRGKTFLSERKTEQALLDFRTANAKKIHLPSLDLMADTLLLFPDYAETYSDFLKEIDTRLVGYVHDRSDGYLPHQVTGKCLLLRKNYALASRAFQESLNYPCFDSWNNLYLWGCCELQLHRVSVSMSAFSQSVAEIQADPGYLDNAKKAATALFSLIALARTEEADALSKDIARLHSMDYRPLIEKLHAEQALFQRYLQKMNAEESLVGEERLSALGMEIERCQFQCEFLKVQLIAGIASRVVQRLFQRGEYLSGVSACEQARRFDDMNPSLLHNQGSCYYMLGRYDLAQCCYQLAAYYETDDLRKRENQEAWKQSAQAAASHASPKR